MYSKPNKKNIISDEFPKYIYIYVVQIFKAVVCKVEMSEFLKHVHVFNDRDFVVGQIQYFKL